MTGNGTSIMTLGKAVRLAEERAASGDHAAAADVYRQIAASGMELPVRLADALRTAAAGPGNPSAAADVREALREFGETYLADARHHLGLARKALDDAAALVGRAVEVAPWLPEAGAASWAVERCRGPLPFSHAQFEQDLWLVRNVFGEKRNGTFVDVGAFDGVTGSNTYLFERFLGWSGVCIEPDPDHFDRLVGNRGCQCVRTCIGCSEGTAEFVRVTSGLLMMGGLAESYDPETLERVRRQSSTEIVRTRVQRLDTVLGGSGLTEVDYLSIDVEGAELSVLRSLDFRTIGIRAISVENNGSSDEVRWLLRREGFRHAARLGVDDMFVRD